jgi:hypothetical protein
MLLRDDLLLATGYLTCSDSRSSGGFLFKGKLALIPSRISTLAGGSPTLTNERLNPTLSAKSNRYKINDLQNSPPRRVTACNSPGFSSHPARLHAFMIV